MSDLIDELLQSSAQNDILGNITHRGAYGVLKYEIDITTSLRRVLHKDCGHYVTFKFKQNFLWSKRIQKYIAHLVSQSLQRYFEPFKLKNILVVGLGNGNMVCDSLGKLVCQNLCIVDIKLSNALQIPHLSYILPSVEGVTGISSFELINSLCKSVKPDMVLMVDSLTATSLTRLGFTIQLSNAGIMPGGGVGNGHKVLNHNTLNVPIVSLGVPLLININDMSLQPRLYTEFYQHFTPKEIDYVIKECAKIIAMAINSCIYPPKLLDSFV